MPTATKQPQAANPATRRIILAVGVVVVALAAFFVLKPIISPSAPKGGDPSNSIPALKAVKTFDYVGAQHTSDPVTYAETPPAGGPHDPVWEDCGVYTAADPQRERRPRPRARHGLGHLPTRAPRQPTSRPSRPRSAR